MEKKENIDINVNQMAGVNNNFEITYLAFFKHFFESVKHECDQQEPSKDSGEFSSSDIAFKEAISALPCPVSVLRLNVDVNNYKEAENDVYHLIKYHFSNFGETYIEYPGAVDLDDLGKYINLLGMFNINEERLQGLKNFKLAIGYGNPDRWYWVWIIPYDILDNFDKYVRDFLKFFRVIFGDTILQDFGIKTDYNKKYNLNANAILSYDELLVKDEKFTPFVKLDKSGRSQSISIGDLQKSILDVRLIPGVPEKVEKVLNAAKRLYVFGYFEYYFFTISQHYSVLALESAIRYRYDTEYGSPKKYIGLEKIIGKLVKDRIIPKAQEGIYKKRSNEREFLIHHTYPPVLFPDSRILERTAFLINQLFETESQAASSIT